MEKNSWFYESLEKKRKDFEEGSYTIVSRLKTTFSRWDVLVREDDASLQNRSSGRRSIRRRARDLIREVYEAMDPDVFLLCTLVTSISKLATVKTEGLIRDLSQWWKAKPHPYALTEASTALCKEYSVSDWFISRKGRLVEETTHATNISTAVLSRKRGLSEVTSVGDVQTYPLMRSLLTGF